MQPFARPSSSSLCLWAALVVLSLAGLKAEAATGVPLSLQSEDMLPESNAPEDEGSLQRLAQVVEKQEKKPQPAATTSFTETPADIYNQKAKKLNAEGGAATSADSASSEKKAGIRTKSAFSSYLAAAIAQEQGDLTEAAKSYLKADISTETATGVVERAFSFQLAAGNMEEALRLAKLSANSEKPMPMAWILLGLNAAKQGDLKGARAYIDKAQSRSPKLLQFQLIKSYIDFYEGRKVDDIIADLKAFNKEEKSYASYRQYQIGQLLENAGRLGEASAAYEEALKTDPSSGPVVRRLGALYERQGERKKAEALYTNYISQSPSNATFMQPLMQRFQAGKPVKVEKPSLSSDLAEVMFGLATVTAVQMPGMATYHLLNITTWLQPGYPFAEFYYGLMEEQNEHPRQAMVHYAKVGADDPSYLAARLRLAELTFATGEEDAAISMMEKMAKQNPELPSLRYALMDMHYAAKHYEKVISAFNDELAHVTKPEPKHALMYFMRGASHERLGHMDKAVADLEESLKIDPNNPLVLNYLGYMWAEKGVQLDKAFAYIRKALLLNPNDGATMDSMGWVFYQKGDSEKAVLFLEKAAEASPDDATILSHLGDAYAKLGRQDEAKVQWKRALEMKPEKEIAAHLKAQLKATE